MLSQELKDKYNVPIIPMNILNMQERDMYDILREALYEFPVLEVKINMPEWITVLNKEHYLKKTYIEKLKRVLLVLIK